MHTFRISSATLVAVLCTTSVLAQEAAVKGWGTFVGIGVIERPGSGFVGTGIGLPLLEAEKDSISAGPSAGLALAFEIGRIQETPVFLEMSGTLFASSSTGIAIHDLTGRNSVFMGIGAPAGVVNLTAGGGSAFASITGADAGDVLVSGSTPPGGGSQAVFGYDRLGAAGAYAGIVTGGVPNAAAYGVVLSPEGFAFAGVGDMSGTLLRSEARRSSVRAGMEIALGVPIQIADEWTIVPRLGGTYKVFSDELSHEVLVDPHEGAGMPDRFPVFGIRTQEDLKSWMLGPIASISVSRQFDRHWNATVGAGVGWLFTGSDWVMTATGLMEGMPETTLPGAAMSSTGGTALLRMDGAISYAADNGTVFSLQGRVEHLSAVPVTKAVAQPMPSGPIDLSLPSSSRAIGTAPAFEYGLSLSMTRRF